MGEDKITFHGFYMKSSKQVKFKAAEEDEEKLQKKLKDKSDADFSLIS